MTPIKCPHCGNADQSLLERLMGQVWFCQVCSKMFVREEGTGA